MGESQKEYKDLASIYDYLVATIDYDDWFKYIQKILNRINYTPNSVADLACGTGETTIPFAKQGISSYGIDISKKMLEVADIKAKNNDLDITYLEQDMKELDLPEVVDLIVSYHDGMNYILSISDLHQVFNRAYKNLVNDGYFIFDLNSVNRFQGVEDEEGITIIDEDKRFLAWQTDYDQLLDIWTIDLTGFIEVEEGLYRRFKESHREKYYSEGEVLSTLQKVGFKVEDYYEAFTWQKPGHNSSRIMYIAKKV
ncbi:class I SAM-dependent DNA methyltransferase [Selenihalanaerobacter shriftii]|uniref:Methyltransferase domain-containing protein n=1 Tax=Selenihalanaerobacter shriftii TaxID=142842 RepID=A0A1T4K7W6_9FIRM|nr:class I SAM-dependent methyltransferase [Selenihalanaerobacter shriftii]SJZ38415.1 Methyltransferase domain-containing protein [Selenihalanaerobacter shriftii]